MCKAEVSICMGSSCFSRGNNTLLERLLEYLEQEGLHDRIQMTGSRCEGACQGGPNVRVDGRLYGDMTFEKLKAIIDDRADEGGRG